MRRPVTTDEVWSNGAPEGTVEVDGEEVEIGRVWVLDVEGGDVGEDWRLVSEGEGSNGDDEDVEALGFC